MTYQFIYDIIYSESLKKGKFIFMKKFGITTLLLCSVVLLSACTSTDKSNNTKSEADSTLKSSSKKQTIPSDYIKISEPYFKPKEQVKDEYEQLGLKVKFVVTNFDNKADTNQKKLIKGMCDQLSDQTNVMYFYDEDDMYNPDNGYYAKKGSTIYVGYTDHAYDPKPVEEVFGTTSQESSPVNVSKSSSPKKENEPQTDNLPVFENDIITIKYDTDSNYFNIKNKTDNAITLTNDWEGPLINGKEINPFNGFAGVDVESKSSTDEQVVLEYNSTGEEMTTSEKNALVKKGDNILHVSGKIFNQSDENQEKPLGTFSFDIHVDSGMLK